MCVLTNMDKKFDVFKSSKRDQNHQQNKSGKKEKRNFFSDITSKFGRLPWKISVPLLRLNQKQYKFSPISLNHSGPIQNSEFGLVYLQVRDTNKILKKRKQF